MFINVMRREGAQAYIYNEEKQKSIIDFEAQTKREAIFTAKSLSRFLSYYQQRFKTEDEDELVENLLWSRYGFDHFDKEEIESLVDMLVPTNMFAIFTSRLLKEDLDKNPELYT